MQATIVFDERGDSRAMVTPLQLTTAGTEWADKDLTSVYTDQSRAGWAVNTHAAASRVWNPNSSDHYALPTEGGKRKVATMVFWRTERTPGEAQTFINKNVPTIRLLSSKQLRRVAPNTADPNVLAHELENGNFVVRGAHSDAKIAGSWMLVAGAQPSKKWPDVAKSALDNKARYLSSFVDI